ncbi:MAG TPA: gluconate 2-dehydrogenase subunit 3 family protein [Vicinamibacterales bacterium]|nr:gluconate 2-dehydrogenase subunit 3 family protein [Vicinamibacterales bacterium]
MASQSGQLSRRGALRRLGVGAGALAVWPVLSDEGLAAFARIQEGAASAPVFLSAAQYAATEAVAETIIPEDGHSPGARAARVADYIDLLLSEVEPDVQRAWVSGLVELDRVARSRGGRPFAELPAEGQLALLTELSRREANPTTPLEKFFKDAKDATIRGYYTSEVGIQRDLKYQGNTFLPEFVGCTHPEHGYEP